MNRFFLTPDDFSGNKVFFPADISHQVIHVLRLPEGEIVAVLDNHGSRYEVAVHFDDKNKQVIGTILQVKSVASARKVDVALYFGLSNREKVEWILQKGTELGISAFHPFISSRTLVQSKELPAKKLARWNRIIREAAEQSHQGYLATLNPPVDLQTGFSNATAANHLSLIAWEEAAMAESKLRQLLTQFNGSTIALFIGPEGGFSEGEIGLARACGCQVVSLGDSILRMETAAIVLPALVFYELRCGE